MKPIEDQVILVTGATDGIGKLTARRLAQLGARVLLHGRNPEKCRIAGDEIREAAGDPNAVTCYTADFAELSAVHAMAADIRGHHDKLDVLINNAGVLPASRRSLSEDGFELAMAVNYLAPFLLTHELLPLLRRSAPSRIVNVASTAQQPIDFDDIMLEHGYSGMRAYAQSKLALVMFTFELADRLAAENITVNCLHPGSLLDTKMVREAFAHSLGSAASGAEVEIHVATARRLEGVTGTYFDTRNPSRAHPQAYDLAARGKLWRLTEQLVATFTMSSEPPLPQGRGNA